jgi:hypothetical protein
VKEVFTAAGITVSKAKANNSSGATVAVTVCGKVRIQKKSYDWNLFFEFKDSKIIYVAFEGPGTEMSLIAQAEIYFSPRKYSIAADDLRQRVEKHDEEIEKLIQGQREILNTVSIFNKTVSAALANFNYTLPRNSAPSSTATS